MSSWEWQAEDWARWARTPGHDSDWVFRDLFFDAIAPTPGRLTLEVGCGEGRVARDLAQRGHTVVAADGRGRHAAPAALTVRPGYERWQRLPNFLHYRAVKPS